MDNAGATSIDSSWTMMEARSPQVGPGAAEPVAEVVGVYVGEPEDRQGGKGGLQDELCGLVPASGSRDHRARDDRAIYRRPGLAARILASRRDRRMAGLAAPCMRQRY